MEKILIIQTAFLGDVILATPVISELHRLYPDASIDFLLRKGNESLLENNEKLNSLLIFNKKEGKIKSLRTLLKKIRNERYDLVINLHRFGSSGILAGLSKGKKIYGFQKNPFSFLYTKKFDHKIGNNTHEVARNLSLIEEFGAEKLIRPELFPSKNDVKAILPYKTGSYYCMAPASVWFTKQFPRHRWVKLIQGLNKDESIYLLGGPDDFDLCEDILKKSNQENIINLSGKLSLLESAALMSSAKMNYVNDSGPLHIASSMNANVTAFFCSTIPAFGFGPLSDISIIKQVEDLECRPCGLHGHEECPLEHFDCGKKIEI